MEKKSSPNAADFSSMEKKSSPNATSGRSPMREMTDENMPSSPKTSPGKSVKMSASFNMEKKSLPIAGSRRSPLREIMDENVPISSGGFSAIPLPGKGMEIKILPPGVPFHSPLQDFLREIEAKTKIRTASEKQQRNSGLSAKPMTLFDAGSTPVDTSLLIPSTIDITDQISVDSLEEQENRKPRLSILGGFDPLFSKEDTNDNSPESLIEKSDQEQSLPLLNVLAENESPTVPLISDTLVQISDFNNSTEDSPRSVSSAYLIAIIDRILATVSEDESESEKCDLDEYVPSPVLEGILNGSANTDVSNSTLENTVIVNELFNSSSLSTEAGIVSDVTHVEKDKQDISSADQTKITLEQTVKEDQTNDLSATATQSTSQEQKVQLPLKQLEKLKSPLHDSLIELFDKKLTLSSPGPQNQNTEKVQIILENIGQELSSEIAVHMSEASENISVNVCDKPVNKIPAEVNNITANEERNITETESFKQCDVANGINNSQPKLEILVASDKEKLLNYRTMMERVTAFEVESNESQVKIAELLKEVNIWQQKSSDLESEVSNLKSQTKELNSVIEEYKAKKDVPSDASHEEMNTLQANEIALKNEIKELKLAIKQLETKLSDLKSKEAKLTDELNNKTQTELQISRVMEEYEKSISSLVAENERMKGERDTAQMHLANIELAFSDVHQKYERCKTIVKGFKDNEEMLRQNIAMNEETILKQEQKYETLKVHAMSQLEKSNVELASIKKRHEQELARLTAQLKRFEIKNNSLMEALQQKSKECEQLSAVCDEFIGNV